MRICFKISFLLLVVFAESRITLGQGVLRDSIHCKEDGGQIYAAYFPAGYNNDRQLPLLLLFDPAGRGSVPLNRYASLAERYQIIMACSYKARNGPFDVSLAAGYAMLKDMLSQHPIDKSKLLLSGFSGGARTATLLAIQDEQFKGVIACGATFPPGAQIEKGMNIPYSVIAGVQDMNYLEALSTFDYLQSIAEPCQLINFNGSHAWASTAAFDEALQWQLLNLNHNRSGDVARHLVNRSKELMDSARYVEAFVLAKSYQNCLLQGQGRERADSIVDVISKNSKYTDQAKLMMKNRQTEDQFYRDFDAKYASAMWIAETDSAFVESKWSSLHSSVSRLLLSKTQDKKVMGQRMADYCQLRGAEEGRRFLKDKQLKRALLAFQIWSVFKENEPWPYINIARAYAQLGERSKCLSNFKKSIDRGFADKHYVATNPELAILANEIAYQNLMK